MGYIASDKVNLTATSVDHSPYTNESGLVQTTWYNGHVVFGTEGQPTFVAGAAPPAASVGVFFGSGAPTLSAAKGSIYLRTDGSGIGDRLYVASNAAGTWTAVTTAA